MKRWCLCLACALLLAGCTQRAPEPAVIAGDPELTEASRLDVAADVHAETTLPQEEITVTALRRDADVYGFEMRFRRSRTLKSILSDPENLYFGVLDTGKQRIAVPMEEIRVLPDVPTGSFVVTLLVPQGEKLSGSKCRVGFYASARDGDPSNAHFAAEKDVQI